MSNYILRRAPDGMAFRDQIIAMVRDRRRISEQATTSFRNKLPEYYDLWRGYYSGRFTPTKNSIHIPLIYSTIWSDVARKIATAYSRWPVVSFAGHGPDDAPIARKQEALVNAQLRDAEVIDKEITTFLSADLYGSAVSQVMWDHREEVRDLTTFKALPLSGETVRQMEKSKVILYDGPNYRPLDLLDFFPQPGYRTINGMSGMRWCIVRYYLDLDQCRFLASEAGGSIFIQSEIDRLISDSAVSRTSEEPSRLRRFEARMGISYPYKDADKYNRPVELTEMWGEIPSEFASGFGGTNVVITVANDGYLFRARPNPFTHSQKPFIKYSPTPDPHYFFAPGKAEIAYHLQIAGNRFVNHQLDAADLLVHPMFLYDRNRILNTRNLVAGPGKIFGTNGPPGDAIVPLQMDVRGLQVGGQMTEVIWRFMNMGTGIQDDTIMGGGGAGSDRQTAREFLGRREASGTRLMLESVIYDQTYLEPLADFFCAMDIQMLDLPREVLILGDSASNDPVTGNPINTSRLQIHPEDMATQYAARANGTTMSMSQETEKANLLTMFQILAGSNEALAGSFNMVNYLRQMLTKLGFTNVNELIQKQPSVADMLSRSGGPEQASAMPADAGGLAAMMGGGAPSGPTSGIPQQ